MPFYYYAKRYRKRFACDAQSHQFRDYVTHPFDVITQSDQLLGLSTCQRTYHVYAKVNFVQETLVPGWTVFICDLIKMYCKSQVICIFTLVLFSSRVNSGCVNGRSFTWYIVALWSKLQWIGFCKWAKLIAKIVIVFVWNEGRTEPIISK